MSDATLEDFIEDVPALAFALVAGATPTSVLLTTGTALTLELNFTNELVVYPRSWCCLASEADRIVDSKHWYVCSACSELLRPANGVPSLALVPSEGRLELEPFLDSLSEAFFSPLEAILVAAQVREAVLEFHQAIER